MNLLFLHVFICIYICTCIYNVLKINLSKLYIFKLLNRSASCFETACPVSKREEDCLNNFISFSQQHIILLDKLMLWKWCVDSKLGENRVIFQMVDSHLSQ